MEITNNIISKDLEYIYRSLKEDITHIKGKHILLTGGAGFLGYYLVQFLLYWNDRQKDANNIRLTIFDNYIRGIPGWLERLKNNNNLEIRRYDITDPLPPNMDDFQYIIHAASIASPTYYRKYPIETMDANVNGLRSLLEYCINQKKGQKPVEGFLFFSSSEVYGDPSQDNIPTPESYNGFVSFTGPRACYDESKRYGETLCVNFAKQYDLPIKIARPFNNYGPGLKITDKRVLPDLARDVFAGRDITLLSDGSPTRTFCYIADAIIGYFKVLLRGRNGEAYNIGVADPEISMRKLAEHVAQIAKETFEYKGKVQYHTASEKEYLIDNPNRRCPNIDKAKNELEYDPKISLTEGLKRTLIWYSRNLEGEEA